MWERASSVNEELVDTVMASVLKTSVEPTVVRFVEPVVTISWPPTWAAKASPVATNTLSWAACPHKHDSNNSNSNNKDNNGNNNGNKINNGTSDKDR